MSDLKAVPRNDRIQLAPMIEEVLADLSPLAEKSGVTLSQTGEDLWITGSDVLVYRAIFNLVENGVKYNHPGGSVCVAASRRGREKRSIEVNGHGLRHPGELPGERVPALLPGGQVPQPGKGRRGAGAVAGLGDRPSARRRRSGSGERRKRNSDRADAARLGRGTGNIMRREVWKGAGINR